MYVLLSITIVIVIIIVARQYHIFLKNRRKLNKKRVIREVISVTAPYIYDLEYQLKRGFFEDYPSLKIFIQKTLYLFKLHNEGVDFKTDIDLKKAFSDMFKETSKANQNLENLIEEINAVKEEEIKESIKYAIVFAYFSMTVNHPFKYKVCGLLIDFKKNILVRILDYFERRKLNSICEIELERYKVEIENSVMKKDATFVLPEKTSILSFNLERFLNNDSVNIIKL